MSETTVVVEPAVVTEIGVVVEPVVVTEIAVVVEPAVVTEIGVVVEPPVITEVTVEVTQGVGPVGPPGPPGPVGGPGPPGPEGATHMHTQVGASAEWIIVHNLGRYPSVVLTLDSDPGEVVYSDVFHDSLTTTRIILPAPESGEAHLN